MSFFSATMPDDGDDAGEVWMDTDDVVGDSAGGTTGVTSGCVVWNI